MNVFVHAASTIDRSIVSGLVKSAVGHFTNTPVAEVKKIGTIFVNNSQYQETLVRLGLVLQVSNVTVPKPPTTDLAVYIDTHDSGMLDEFARGIANDYFPSKPTALASEEYIILCYAVTDSAKLKGTFGADQKEQFFNQTIKQKNGKR